MSLSAQQKATSPKKAQVPKAGRTRPAIVHLIQLAIIFAFLFAWEFIPKIDVLHTVSPVFDPFFISSPTAVAGRIYGLATGINDNIIWPYMGQTVLASIVGAIIGIIAGLGFGLLFSGSELISRIFMPFLAAINSIPRIAFIPVVVVIFGPQPLSTTVIAVLVVFFIAFYNAFEGGRSVPPELLHNARVLGATPAQVTLRVRLPYVMAWTFAALPVMIGFALLAVVTAEILSGVKGIGYLVSIASISAQSSLTFAIVAYLAVLGVVMVQATNLIRARVLHWWAK